MMLQENVAAKSASSRSTAAPRSAPAAASPLSSARPSAPVRFSNDIKRLRHVNGIRKAPVGAQMKRAIDILFQTRRGFTPEQIDEACSVDVNGNKDVFEGLKRNPKVNFDGKSFSYKAKHDVKNKDELLVLIRKHIEGISVVDLKDAYPNVIQDLQALKAAGRIWQLSNCDSREDIVFPDDSTVTMKLDDELKELYRSIELTRDMHDIERDLQKNGTEPATAKRKAAAQMQGISFKSKPKQKIVKPLSKRAKLTNIHIPELFQN